MSHLKLVVDNKKNLEQSDVDLKMILQSKPWTNEEASLIQEIDQYSSFFKMKLADPQNAENFSKHFMIFCFNYYELGLEEKAREMLQLIRPEYFKEQFLKDMEEAVDHRNKAEELARKRKLQKAFEHRVEAEYFVVAVKILPYLEKEELIKDLPYFQEFLTNLKSKSFTIKMCPSMDIVKE